MPDVVITDRLSDANPRRISDVISLQASWPVSAAGVMTFSCTRDQIFEAGLDPKRLISKWIRYEHPTAGKWGGFVSAVNPGDGMMAISCEGWAALLRGVNLFSRRGFSGGGTYNVASVVGAIEQNKTTTGVSASAAPNMTTGGVRMGYGTDIYDGALPAALQASEILYPFQTSNIPPFRSRKRFYYRVDQETRALRVDEFPVADVGDSVVVSGLAVASCAVSDDTTDVVNRVILESSVEGVVGQTGTYCIKRDKKGRCKQQSESEDIMGQIPTYARADNAASVLAYGPHLLRGGPEGWFQGYSNSSLLGACQKLVKHLSENEQLVSMAIVDEEGIFSAFREGYLVGFDLPLCDASGVMFVRERALNVDTGEMAIVGEAQLL